MPTMTLDDVTPQTLSTWTLGKIPPTDPRSIDLIAGAVTAIRNYCGWHVSPVKAEEVTLDGKGGTIQKVRSTRIVSVQSVEDAGRPLQDRTDYTWSEAGMFRRTRGRWSCEFRDIVINLTHGYEATPDLVGVVHAVTSRAMSSPMGATREQALSLSVTWATSSPGVSGGLALYAHELELLDHYRAN